MASRYSGVIPTRVPADPRSAPHRGFPVHIHALEQQDETVVVRSLKGGRDEIHYFDDQGLLATDLRLAHGVWLADGHLDRLRDHGTSVVHCPSSNLKLGSGIADLLAVRHTLVAGRLLVEDGRLTHLDLEEIYRESTRCLADLIRRSGVDL
jgi:hypothetical protein